VWADLAPKLYAHAASAQWDPATAVGWDAEFTLPAAIEVAVVQVMTYLVENEQAALVIPARLLARVHPHFREVLQLLAVQAADEARHVEVFTRRALLRGGTMGTSSAGGRASLATLLQEPDFSLASFLLSVLGEGSFLSLLSFLDTNAPDPVTARSPGWHGRTRHGTSRSAWRTWSIRRPRTLACWGACERPSSGATMPSPTRPA